MLQTCRSCNPNDNNVFDLGVPPACWPRQGELMENDGKLGHRNGKNHMVVVFVILFDTKNDGKSESFLRIQGCFKLKSLADFVEWGAPPKRSPHFR